MERLIQGAISVGMCFVIALLALTALPIYARRSGGGSHAIWLAWWPVASWRSGLGHRHG